MSSIERILGEMVEDVSVLCSGRGAGKKNENEKETRIASVSARALGALAVAFGAVSLGLAGVYAVVAITVSPVALIAVAACVAMAAVAIVAGHDFFVMGSNFRKDLSMHDNSQNILNRAAGFISAAAREARASINESHRYFEGTWVFGPLYRLANKI